MLLPILVGVSAPRVARVWIFTIFGGRAIFEMLPYFLNHILVAESDNLIYTGDASDSADGEVLGEGDG